ncbi:hypothetical protein Tco_0313482 [Tanacetum coccineum]
MSDNSVEQDPKLILETKRKLSDNSLSKTQQVGKLWENSMKIFGFNGGPTDDGYSQPHVTNPTYSEYYLHRNDEIGHRTPIGLPKAQRYCLLWGGPHNMWLSRQIRRLPWDHDSKYTAKFLNDKCKETLPSGLRRQEAVRQALNRCLQAGLDQHQWAATLIWSFQGRDHSLGQTLPTATNSQHGRSTGVAFPPLLKRRQGFSISTSRHPPSSKQGSRVWDDNLTQEGGRD